MDERVYVYVYVYVCMCVCVCMYVCMHVLCMYVCMYVCMYACVYVCMYVCTCDDLDTTLTLDTESVDQNKQGSDNINQINDVMQAIATST